MATVCSIAKVGAPVPDGAAVTVMLNVRDCVAGVPAESVTVYVIAVCATVACGAMVSVREAAVKVNPDGRLGSEYVFAPVPPVASGKINVVFAPVLNVISAIVCPPKDNAVDVAAAFTVISNVKVCVLAVGVAESVTVYVAVVVDTISVGMIDKTRVLALNVKPAGNPVKVYVFAPTPPIASGITKDADAPTRTVISPIVWLSKDNAPPRLPLTVIVNVSESVSAVGVLESVTV